MKKYKINFDTALLCAAALLAVFIRVYRFGSVPGGMNQDGAMAAVDAAALAAYGTDRLGMRFPVHLTAWGFGQMSALMSYLMAPCIALFGLSVTSARLPMLLVSLASLGILYLFAKDLHGRQGAAIALALAAICPWHILQSRWALDCNLFPHFFLAGIFLLNRGVRRRRRREVYASMAFFGLSMYCYGISVYTVPVFLLAACIVLLVRREIAPARAGVCALIWLAVSAPFLLCMAINALGGETIETGLFTIPYFPDSLRSSDILFFSAHPLQQLSVNLRALLQILSQRYDGALCNEVPGFGTLYGISLPFQILGAVFFFRNAKKNTGCLLTVLWFLTALWSGLITASVNINRLNLIFYPLLLFAGAGIWEAVRFLGSFRRARAAAALIPAAFLIAFALFTHTYFTSYAGQISAVFMEDFGEAVSAISESGAEHVYISPDAQYKGLWYVSEVLTLFWQDIDAAYYQSAEFAERYRFSVPSDPDPEEDAVYVLAASDLPNYSEELYAISSYGRFYTAEPKRSASE